MKQGDKVWVRHTYLYPTNLGEHWVQLYPAEEQMFSVSGNDVRAEHDLVPREELDEAVKIVSDLLAAMKGAPNKKGIDAYDQAEEFIAEHTGIEMPSLTTKRQQVEQLQAELDEALELLKGWIDATRSQIVFTRTQKALDLTNAFLAKHKPGKKPDHCDCGCGMTDVEVKLDKIRKLVTR